MIQDIFPSKLDNHYVDATAEERDFVLRFDREGRLLVSIADGRITFPTGAQIPGEGAVYLFSVDGERYFLEGGREGDTEGPEGYEFRSLRELRDSCIGKELLIAFTAYHLWKWYST